MLGFFHRNHKSKQLVWCPLTADREVPEFFLCAKKKKKQLACLVIIQGGLLDFSPPNNPINERALSLGSRLSLFSEVSYNRSLEFRGFVQRVAQPRFGQTNYVVCPFLSVFLKEVTLFFSKFSGLSKPKIPPSSRTSTRSQSSIVFSR